MVIGTSPDYKISVQGECRYPVCMILEDHELFALRLVNSRPPPSKIDLPHVDPIL